MMELLTGLALFGGGVLLGGMTMAKHYAGLKHVQRRERRKAEKEVMELNMQLKARTNLVLDMQKYRAEEASWCDGYEAGLREGMEYARNGIRIGDVVTFTRIRNARRINSAND